MQSTDVMKLREEIYRLQRLETAKVEDLLVEETEEGFDPISPQDLEGPCERWQGPFYRGDGRPRKYLPGGRDVVATRWIFMQRNQLSDEQIKGYIVSSYCGSKRCVNEKHLFLTTNKAEKFAVGERNFGSKLTEEQVVEIRKTYRRAMGRGENNTGNAKELMDKYGITRAGLSKIVNRKRWKHVV